MRSESNNENASVAQIITRFHCKNVYFVVVDARWLCEFAIQTLFFLSLSTPLPSSIRFVFWWNYDLSESQRMPPQSPLCSQFKTCVKFEWDKCCKKWHFTKFTHSHTHWIHMLLHRHRRDTSSRFFAYALRMGWSVHGWHRTEAQPLQHILMYSVCVGQKIRASQPKTRRTRNAPRVGEQRRSGRRMRGDSMGEREGERVRGQEWKTGSLVRLLFTMNERGGEFKTLNMWSGRSCDSNVKRMQFW